MAIKMERDNMGSCKNFASSSVNNDCVGEGESNQSLNSRTLRIGTSQFDDQKEQVEMVWTC